jgi:hypothetical protein
VARSAPMRCMPMYQHTNPTTVTTAACTAPLVGTGSYGAAQAAGSALVFAGVAVGSGALAARFPRRGRSGTGHRPAERSLEKL